MYLSTGINDSPTIVGKAGIPMINAALHAAKFDDQGELVPALAGENAIGLFIATTPDSVAPGDDVTVQIKEMGLWITGDAVVAGAELTSNAGAQAVPAVVGDYVTAIALETAAAPGTVIKVQINKCGRKGAVALNDLADVNLDATVDTEVLKYDAAGNEWNNSTVELTELGDVELTAPDGAEVLKYDSGTSKWNNEAVALDELSDVVLTDPQNTQALKYDDGSSKWKNAADAID